MELHHTTSNSNPDAGVKLREFVSYRSLSGRDLFKATAAARLRGYELLCSTMDPLSAYGALAVTAMLVFYALEPRSPVFVLAFACACLASSGYGFLQGAWPFGVVEFIWSGVALRRWWVRRRTLAN
jgi:hypothetical protein